MKKSSTLNQHTLVPKVLHTGNQFSQFVYAYHAKHGMPTQIEYLEKCHKVAVFTDTNDNWLAGYCINAKPGMRYLSTFDPLTKRRILKDKQLKEEEIVEISQIWMDKSIFLKPELRLAIYAAAVNAALATQKPIIIGGSIVASVWKGYEAILPNELYFGYVPFAHGYQFGKIVYASRDAVMENIEVAVAK